MGQPTKQQLEFAEDYSRTEYEQLKTKELKEFFDIASDSPYYRLRDECKALGIIKPEPKYKSVSSEDLHKMNDRLGELFNTPNSEIFKFTNTTLHKLAIYCGPYNTNNDEIMKLIDDVYTESLGSCNDEIIQVAKDMFTLKQSTQNIDEVMKFIRDKHNELLNFEKLEFIKDMHRIISVVRLSSTGDDKIYFTNTLKVISSAKNTHKDLEWFLLLNFYEYFLSLGRMECIISNIKDTTLKPKHIPENILGGIVFPKSEKSEAGIVFPKSEELEAGINIPMTRKHYIEYHRKRLDLATI